MIRDISYHLVYSLEFFTYYNMVISKTLPILCHLYFLYCDVTYRLSFSLYLLLSVLTLPY